MSENIIHTYTYCSGIQNYYGQSTWSGVEYAYDVVTSGTLSGTAVSGTYAYVEVSKDGTVDESSNYLIFNCLSSGVRSLSGIDLDRILLRTWFYNEFVGYTDDVYTITDDVTGFPRSTRQVDPFPVFFGFDTSTWENTNNITEEDGFSSTNVLEYSYMIIGDNFGFTVASGYDVKGIEVTIKTSGQDPDFEYDLLLYGVELVNSEGLSISNRKGNDSRLYNASGDVIEPQTMTFGGPNDLWGATLSTEDVTSSGFGVGVTVTNEEDEAALAYLHYISMKVYFSATYSGTPNPESIVYINDELFLEVGVNYDGSITTMDDYVSYDLYNFMPAFNNEENLSYIDTDIMELSGSPYDWTADDLEKLTAWVRVYHGYNAFTTWKSYLSHIELIVDGQTLYGFVIYDGDGEEVMKTKDGITRVFYSGNDTSNYIPVGFATQYNLFAFSFPLDDEKGSPEIVPGTINEKIASVRVEDANKELKITGSSNLSAAYGGCQAPSTNPTSCNVQGMASSSANWDIEALPLDDANYKILLVGVGR